MTNSFDMRVVIKDIEYRFTLQELIIKNPCKFCKPPKCINCDKYNKELQKCGGCYQSTEYEKIRKIKNWLALDNKPDRFTGLLDAKGNRIYEGDILIHLDTEYKTIFVVEYNEACAGFVLSIANKTNNPAFRNEKYLKFGYERYSDSKYNKLIISTWAKEDHLLHSLEVIGNVHINPGIREV